MTRGVGLLLAAVLLGACSQPPSALTLDSIASPIDLAGSAPRLTSSNDRTILSWMHTSANGRSLQFAERTSTGWSDPRVVVTGRHLVVNSADVPSVLALENGALAAHWMVARGTGPEAYDVQLAWSQDDGRTWSDPVSPHDDGTDTQHGFVSLFERPGAGLGLVWLDGRATRPDALDVSARGDMALRAATYDASHRQTGDVVIDARVCECCPTAVASTQDGVVVVYRGRSAANVRDIEVARLTDTGWTAPRTLHDDGWTLSACPVNGPSVDARGPAVVVGWFTLQEAEGRAFVAFSNDSGLTFGAPIRVDDESARGRLQVALLDDGAAAVAWIEFADRQSQLRLRRVSPGGARSDAVTVAGGMGTQHPRMVRGRDELLLAWVETDATGPRVRTARAAY